MSRHNSPPEHDASGPDAVRQDKSAPDVVESGQTGARETSQADTLAQETGSRTTDGPVESGNSRRAENSPVQQSDAPVDVPRTPDRPTSQTEDVAAEESKPRKNPDDGSVWADTELPAPNKKGVRPQWF